MDNAETNDLEAAGMQKAEFSKDAFFETYGLRILRALRCIIRAVDVHSRHLNNHYKITTPQMICLYTLVQEGAMMLSDLAKQVNLGDSTVNGIVDRLEAKEWVRRHRSRMDRRKVYVEVTDSGREFAQNAPSLLQEHFFKALRELPELEQATIALSLERVVGLMDTGRVNESTEALENMKES